MDVFSTLPNNFCNNKTVPDHSCFPHNWLNKFWKMYSGNLSQSQYYQLNTFIAISLQPYMARSNRIIKVFWWEKPAVFVSYSYSYINWAFLEYAPSNCSSGLIIHPMKVNAIVITEPDLFLLLCLDHLRLLFLAVIGLQPWGKKSHKIPAVGYCGFINNGTLHLG